MSVRDEIISQFKIVAKEQDKELAELNDDLVLLDSGLDSLCIAIVVARLEEILGVDPFVQSDGIDFPVTIRDFIRFYDDARK